MAPTAPFLLALFLASLAFIFLSRLPRGEPKSLGGRVAITHARGVPTAPGFPLLEGLTIR